jgi:hypothetical protein
MYLREAKNIIDNFLRESVYENSRKILYHGSPTPNIKILEPKLDKRLNIKGIFVSKNKYAPMAHALMPERYNTNLNYTTKNNKFINGTIDSKVSLNEKGYLYTIELNNPSDLIKVKDNYILTKPASVRSSEIILKSDLIKLGWKINESTTKFSKNPKYVSVIIKNDKDEILHTKY